MKLAFVTVAALLLAGTVAAAPKVSEAQQRYQEERAACMNGTSNQDRATCLKEAGAAFAEAKAGKLSGDGELARNRMARCDALPAVEREDCAMRMRDGTATGTARDGGILREHTRVVPGR